MIHFSKVVQASGAPIIDGVVLAPHNKSWPDTHGIGVLHPRQWFKRKHSRSADILVCAAWSKHGHESPRLKLFDVFGNRPRVRKAVSILNEVIW